MIYTEKELIAPALYLISKYPGITMAEIIKKIEYTMNPTGNDAEILSGRKDTHFSQKVRNLKSHRDYNGMAEYTDLRNGHYYLTEKGKFALEKVYNDMEALFSFD